MQPDISHLLDISAAQHSHLCPRQVLGVRIGLAGVQTLKASAAGRALRLLVIMETDGCLVDGVGAATGCAVGRRSLRIEDYGKIAATFVDMESEQAVRVAPRLDVRQRAFAYAPGERRHYFAQLTGYQVMPDEELLSIQPVRLARSVAEIMSRAGVRANCDCCGEEIINERELHRSGMTLCRACAGVAYYTPASTVSPALAARPATRRRARPDLPAPARVGAPG